MQPTYLRQTIANLPEDALVDVNAPFGYLEWKQRRPGLIQEQASYQYSRYLLKWFEANKERALSREFLLKQKFYYLLEQLQVFFSEDEKNDWYDKINLANEKELLTSIPFFAKKLKNISLYYLNLRKKLKKTKIRYNMVGTRFGLEQEIYNILAEGIEQNSISSVLENKDYVIDSSVKDAISVQIEELYDDKDYYDKSFTVAPSSYFNLFHEATEAFYNTKGISLSGSGDWIFQALSLPVAEDLNSFVSYLTGTVLEVSDLNLYKAHLEKYLSENKYARNIENTSEDISVNDVTIQEGNNYFYYPGVNTNPVVDLKNVYKTVALSSLNLEEATGGTSLIDSDTVFVKTGDIIKAAWLKFEKHIEEEKIMSALLPEATTTRFLFPYPGYGLSGETFDWTGVEFSTSPEYPFLSNSLKSAVNEAYWNQDMDADTSKPVFINNSRLVESKAWSGKNSKFTDHVFIQNRETQATRGLPLTDKDSAWLFKFDTAVYPILLGSNNSYLWPYQRISQIEPYEDYLKRYDFEGVCNPISIQDISTVYSIGSNKFENADKVYKLSNPMDELANATECCWLSSSVAAHATHKACEQNGFVASFSAGAVTRFVWNGPNTDLDEVFPSISHNSDCPFVTNIPEVTSLDWEKCSCKQIYHTPFGHQGYVFESNNEMADFIALDTTGTNEPFDRQSWRDSAGNQLANSTEFAWFKTNSKTGWGDGQWVVGSNSTPFQLERGKVYFYKRTNSKTEDNEVNGYPFYNVNYSFKNVSNPTKWVAAKLNEKGEWKSTGKQATMLLRAGDILNYERATSTTSYFITSEEVEVFSENRRGNLWATADYIALSSAQDSTFIQWPAGEPPIIDTLNQTPPFKIEEIDTLFWWKIQHTLQPAISALIESTYTDVEKVSSWTTGSGATLQVHTLNYTERVYNNKTLFSFVPPIVGEYKIEVYASSVHNPTSPVLFTNIPRITAVPQYEERELLLDVKHPSSGFLFEQELTGWNYALNLFDALPTVGAKPYWAKLYSDKDESTKHKGIISWGYPSTYLQGYLPDHSPKISPIQFEYGTIVNYKRYGNTITWDQPLVFGSFLGESRWCKLEYSTDNPSNLAELYNSKNRDDLTITQTTEDTDIVLSNILNGYPVEIYYNALSTFTWSISTQNIDSVSTFDVEEPLLYKAQAPWANLGNRFYSTVATVPVLERIFSETDVGGYFLPINLGASMYINRDFEAFVNDTSTNKGSTEDTNIHIGGVGRSKEIQNTSFDHYEQNQWLKEPATSEAKAGGIKAELTKTLQTFVPYEGSSEETPLNLINTRTRMSPWNDGFSGTEWEDSYEPTAFTGVRNLSAWVKKQILRTDNLTIDNWTTDIYGNQYGVFKPLEGVSVTKRRTVPGELWVNKNDQTVAPASEALSYVHERLRLTSVHGALSANQIHSVDCFLDTLMIETSSTFVLCKLDYDYDKAIIKANFDDIVVIENLDNYQTTSPAYLPIVIDSYKRFEATWFFPVEKNLTVLFTELSGSSFVPKLYKFNLNTKLYTNEISEIMSSSISNSLSCLQIKILKKPVMTYNSLQRAYLLTYTGLDIQHKLFFVEIEIEQQEKLSLKRVNVYRESVSGGGGSGTILYPPSVDLSVFGFVNLSSTFVYTVIAEGAPTSWNLISGFPAGLTLSNSGVFSGTGIASGTYHINYKITNSSGTTTLPLTLNIT